MNSRRLYFISLCFMKIERKKAEKGIYKMQEYLISIIVPFYNPGGNFRRCLDSLIHQPMVIWKLF